MNSYQELSLIIAIAILIVEVIRLSRNEKK